MATLLVGLVVAAHLARRLAARGHPGPRRVIAGTIFSGGTVLALGGLTWFYVSSGRAAMILDWGDCRELAVADRPVQIVQLSCNTAFYDLTWFGLAWVTAALGAPALLFLMSARSLLSVSGQPRWPAMLATVVAIAAVTLSGSAVGEDTSAAEWLALGGATAAATLAAWCCWVEVIGRRPNQPA